MDGSFWAGQEGEGALAGTGHTVNQGQHDYGHIGPQRSSGGADGATVGLLVYLSSWRGLCKMFHNPA